MGLWTAKEVMEGNMEATSPPNQGPISPICPSTVPQFVGFLVVIIDSS